MAYNILCIGDVYGRTGYEILLDELNTIKLDEEIDFVVANCENISNGRGISKKIYDELMFNSIDCITMGNHTFGNLELQDFIDGSNVIRPCNIPGAPGAGYKIFTKNDKKICVINVLGRVFMSMFALDCPFQTTKKIVDEIRDEVDYIIVDIHAEATSEKVAFAHYFKGKVDVIFGTHTHVPTSDAHIMEGNTAYITDVGMTGPKNGVIGVESQIIVDRFITGMPNKNKESKDSGQFNCCIVNVDKKSSIKTINKRYE